MEDLDEEWQHFLECSNDKDNEKWQGPRKYTLTQLSRKPFENDINLTKA